MAAVKEIKLFESHQQSKEEKNCETNEELAEEETSLICLVEYKLK
jgi:hypothetical protein